MGILTKAFSVTKDFGRGFRNAPLYSKRSSDVLELVRGWVYTCMNIRAGELANSKFEYEDNGKEILNEGHWIYQLIENPNPYYTWTDFMQLISFWLDLTGNCYILPKTISQGGVTYPISMTVLPSNRCFPEVSGSTVTHYRVTLPNGRSARFIADDIIHIKDMSPSQILRENYYMGSASTLLSIKDVQEIAIKRLDYIESFYAGDGVMPFILTANNEELGVDEAKQILEMYGANLKNEKYRPQAFLPSGVTAVNLGEIQGGKDTISSEDNASIRIQIGAAFGIPSTYLTGEYNGRNVAYDTIQVMNEKNTTPRAVKVARYLNKYLASINNSVRFKHIETPFKNDEFALRQTATLYQLGIIDRDEARIENGYEPEGLVLVQETEKKTSIRKQILNTGIE